MGVSSLRYRREFEVYEIRLKEKAALLRQPFSIN
jgi:hypothetical protein